MKFVQTVPQRAAYLEHDEHTDYASPPITEKAALLFSGAAGVLDRIAIAFVFVRDRIRHSNDCDGRIISRTASETLLNGEGMCYAKSMLLAALLRCQGIPAGFCYQRLRNDDDASGDAFAIHALNAVYIPSFSAWTRIDARGNANGRDARFDAAHPLAEKLAYAVRPDCGEIDYPGIYARHPDCVLQPLSAYSDCQTMMRRGLPSRLA